MSVYDVVYDSVGVGVSEREMEVEKERLTEYRSVSVSVNETSLLKDALAVYSSVMVVELVALTVYVGEELLVGVKVNPVFVMDPSVDCVAETVSVGVILVDGERDDENVSEYSSVGDFVTDALDETVNVGVAVGLPESESERVTLRCADCDVVKESDGSTVAETDFVDVGVCEASTVNEVDCVRDRDSDSCCDCVGDTVDVSDSEGDIDGSVDCVSVYDPDFVTEISVVGVIVRLPVTVALADHCVESETLVEVLCVEVAEVV